MVKKLFVFGILLLTNVFIAVAQTAFKLPKGLVEFADYDSQGKKVEKDFDLDGKLDLAIIATDENNSTTENNYVIVFLSKSKSVSKLPIAINSFYNLSVEKNALVYGACFGNGRYCETYKWRYDTKFATMRLIGYDEESFGNAVHEGAYLKSINLLTNKFELNQTHFNIKNDKEEMLNNVSKIIKTKMFTLKNFDITSLEYLQNFGRQYFKE